MNLKEILKVSITTMLIAAMLTIPGQVSHASTGEDVSNSAVLVGDNGVRVSFGTGKIAGNTKTGVVTATTTTNDGKPTDSIKAKVSTFYGTSGVGDSRINTKKMYHRFQHQLPVQRRITVVLPDITRSCIRELNKLLIRQYIINSIMH